MTTIDRIDILTVVPSPYQRDVFKAMNRQCPGQLRVWYMEQTPPDSPWPRPSLESWETILPGRILSWRGRRSHFNQGTPKPSAATFWIVNGVTTDFTTQRAFRRLGDEHAWAFWGETPTVARSAAHRAVQRLLYRPLRRTRLIAAIGARAVEAYRHLLPGVPVANLPYACDLRPFTLAASLRKTVPAAERDVTFLFCGQMIARKGFDVLLAAFEKVHRNRPHSRLILLGREDDQTAWANLGRAARDATTNLGFQSPDALPALFAQADVFVLPSRHDGWGVVVNQALGAGLPVITTHAVGAAELLDEPISGLITEPGDPDSLAAAMLRLNDDVELRLELAANARRKALDLTPEKVAAFWWRVARSNS